MSRHRRPIEEIAPDDFLSTWGASSYEEAIKEAEQAPTTTPDEELPRCPECESQRIKSKTEKHDGQGAKDGAYVCVTCRNHFDDPAYFDDTAATVVDDPDDLAEKVGPFEWVDPDDLADPPLRRRLAALDDRRLAALAIYLYRPWSPAGPSYRDLESVVPYSSDWVGDRVRAWKDGEYHDLVRDPRPRVSLTVQDSTDAQADG